MGFILISPKPLSVPDDGNEAVGSSRDAGKSPLFLARGRNREELFLREAESGGGGFYGGQGGGCDLFTPVPSKELANSNACPELKRLHHLPKPLLACQDGWGAQLMGPEWCQTLPTWP